MPAQAEVYSCTPGGTILAGRRSQVIDTAIFQENAKQLFFDAPLTAVDDGNGIIVTPADPAVADPKVDWRWRWYGPHRDYVEKYSQWPWINSGGDWIDVGGTPQGASPAATFNANAVTSGSHTYDNIDFTAALQQCYDTDTWNAWVVRCSVNRRWASRHDPVNKPVLTVTYTDLSIVVLKCVATVGFVTGSLYTQVGQPDILMWGNNAVIEWERPTKPILSATLRVHVKTHVAGSAVFNFFLANPPMNAGPPISGLSVDYPNDVGIIDHPDVWFAQNYPDGSVLSDFIFEADTNHNVEYMNKWSPHLFGQGDPANTDKLPYKWEGTDITGKFICGTSREITLVDSAYTGEGFTPPAPGLGALRVQIVGNHTPTGSVSSSPKLGSDLWAFLPEPYSGQHNTIYTRWKQMWAPYPRETVANTKMYRDSSGGTAEHMRPSNKTGMGPQHKTDWGGNDRRGGGNRGWSSRMGIAAIMDMAPDCHYFYWHALDNWYGHGPVGTSGGNLYTGQQGPHGVWLRRGVWYIIETRVTLNTWSEDLENLTADGIFECWIGTNENNMVLVARITNLPLRQGPLNYFDPLDVDNSIDRTYTPLTGTYRPPFREIGHVALWINDYQGGNINCEHDQVIFYAQIVSSLSEQIGPPVLDYPLPAWAPAPGEIKTISYAAGTHPDGPLGGAVMSEISTANQSWNPDAPGVGPWGYSGSFNSILAFSGATFNPDMRELCNIGAGHVAACVPTNWAFRLGDLKWLWKSIPVPSDGFAAAMAEAAISGRTVNDKEWYSDVYVLQEDSPSDWQFDRVWGDWNRDWTGWPTGITTGPAGEIFPETAHSYDSNIVVPAAIKGNAKGIMCKFERCTGKTTGNGIEGTHIFDFDTDKWRRTANLPVKAGGTPALDTLTGMIIRNYSTSGAGSYTLTQWQLFDPITETHGATRTSSNSPGQRSGACTTIDIDQLSRLLFVITSSDASNDNYSATPTKMRMYGADVDTALVSNFSFSEITLSNPSGIWPFFPAAPLGLKSTFQFCPEDGCYYLISGEDGSNKVWRLSRPVGATTQSQHLVGTWTVDVITMPVGSFYCKNSSGVGTNGCFVYSKMQWDDVSKSFLWFSDHLPGPVQAFNPVGV